jgi:hypothetical protein
MSHASPHGTVTGAVAARTHAKRLSPIGLAFAALAALVAGCGNGPLTPTQSCATSIGAANRCGSYTVGAFGGGTEQEDIALCAQRVAALDRHCQSLASRSARCAADAECGSVTCDPARMAFDRDCREP